MKMSRGYYRIADKYAGNGMHYQSRITRNGEIKQHLYGVCRVCGKEFPVKNRKKKLKTCCPDCRKALRKLNVDSDAVKTEPVQAGSGSIVEYK